MAPTEKVVGESQNPSATAKPATQKKIRIDRLKTRAIHDAPSWLLSALFHAALLTIVGLIMGGRAVVKDLGDAPVFEASPEETAAEAPEKIERFELGDAPLEPTELTTESLTMNEPPGQAPQEAVYYDDSPEFEEQGGGMPTGTDTGSGGLGFDLKATGLGPVLRGGGGLEPGKGTGSGFGKGGPGVGFGGRGKGHREALLGRYGGTKQTERAVAAALNWLARHQNGNGSWSIDHFNGRCTDGTCTGPGTARADAAATALGLLPFLAAGQTHQSKGPYKTVINNGIQWLIRNQRFDGDLSGGSIQMYSHGLAAIAMCEAYGMTGDPKVGRSARAAVDFILSGQNPQGGWRYQHDSQDGDTSVYGWQMMALKSAIMAGISVNPQKIESARKWLDLVAANEQGTSQDAGRFSYTPESLPTPCMSAVGLLITQYLGAAKDHPTMIGGARYLMANQPTNDSRDTYYWYYATQVMHNLCGRDWDTWNRRMRRILVESQCKTGCATGSWDPAVPSDDAWGKQGGRLMVTSLSALTLEIYYRYLPLYQLDKPETVKPKKPPAEEPEKSSAEKPKDSGAENPEKAGKSREKPAEVEKKDQ